MNTFTDSLTLTFTVYHAESFIEEFTFTESETRSESFGDLDIANVPYAQPCLFGVFFTGCISFYLNNWP